MKYSILFFFFIMFAMPINALADPWYQDIFSSDDAQLIITNVFVGIGGPLAIMWAVRKVGKLINRS
jgi:hypothetical protein